MIVECRSRSHRSSSSSDVRRVDERRLRAGRPVVFVAHETSPFVGGERTWNAPAGLGDPVIRLKTEQENGVAVALHAPTRGLNHRLGMSIDQFRRLPPFALLGQRDVALALFCSRATLVGAETDRAEPLSRGQLPDDVVAGLTTTHRRDLRAKAGALLIEGQDTSAHRR